MGSQEEALRRILTTLFLTDLGDIRRCRSCGSPIIHLEHLTLEHAKELEAEVRQILHLPATIEVDTEEECS